MIIQKFKCSQICAEENLPSEQTVMKQLGPTKVVLFVLTPLYLKASASSTYAHPCQLKNNYV